MGIRFALCGLVVVGLWSTAVITAAVTYNAWGPCRDGAFTDACLEAMDSPPHFGTVTTIWVVAVGLALLAILLVRSTEARLLTIGGLVTVIVCGNLATEYVVFLALSGGHHDSPPGMGYGVALAFVVAGTLSAVAAVLDARPRRAAALRERASTRGPTVRSS